MHLDSCFNIVQVVTNWEWSAFKTVYSCWGLFYLGLACVSTGLFKQHVSEIALRGDFASGADDRDITRPRKDRHVIRRPVQVTF